MDVKAVMSENVRMLVQLHAERQARLDSMPPCRFERAFAEVFGGADEQDIKPVNINQAQEDAGHRSSDFA